MWRRNCQECGKEYIAIRFAQIYCSPECRKDGLRKYRRDFMRKYWKIRPDKYCNCRNSAKQKDKENKMVVFTHYSGNPPKCACCGEIEIRFLELDHVNGGGNKERKKLFGGHFGGNTFYDWLIKNNFPKGYQVLCCNCNMTKGKSRTRFCLIHHPELYEDVE
jgi:hypothetical protein